MNKKQFGAFLVLAALFLVMMGTAVWAQSSLNFDLSWNVIGSGGSASNSANYAVQGTIGQSVTSPPSASSANFSLNSGYWVTGATTMRIYLPIVLRN